LVGRRWQVTINIKAVKRARGGISAAFMAYENIEIISKYINRLKWPWQCLLVSSK